MTRKLAIWMIPLLLLSCFQETEFIEELRDQPFDLIIPAGFPAPDIPEDNEMTVLRVELGKALFHDTRLSRDRTISCASCHLQPLAFTDGLALSEGIEGRIGMRNSPTLTNAVYQDRFFMDGGVPSLELQVLAPIHNEDEMDYTILEVIERLENDPWMSKMSEAAYGRPVDSFVITRAIAAFERTMISGNSTYDEFITSGDESVLSEEELRGYELFISDELQCNSCHSGFNLTDNDYHNIGLYEEYDDNGRERVTNDPADIGKFKTPTLRNIALTAPYMHDGSIATLEEVVEFLNSGGVGHDNQSELITELNLSEQDKADLVAFLESLSDISFIENPTFQP